MKKWLNLQRNEDFTIWIAKITHKLKQSVKNLLYYLPIGVTDFLKRVVIG